jgi:lipoyl(octanoyl) transferase
MHSIKHVNSPTKNCAVVDLGLISYAAAYALQQQVVVARKRGDLSDVLLLCEHPHVITLGRNGKTANLRASDRLLAQMNVDFCETDRGGDITYHGPGQIVGYPILDLTEHRRDVRWYVQLLEEMMIRTSAEFGIAARRVEGRHGLWVDTAADQEEKLAAIGVHLSRWVTSHGFAYNVSTDLRYFDLIVPCGIPGKRATSLERLLSHAVSLDEVKPKLTTHFGDIFNREIISMSRKQLAALLTEPSAAGTTPVKIISEREHASIGASRGI